MNTARTKVRAKRRTSRTPSRRHPPHEVLECLRQCSVQAEDIKLAAHTDIDLLGNYRDHWLTVTDERLLVIADGALPSIELDVSLDQTRDYRAAMGVGSGLLQARIDSNYVDVLRYSSRGAQQFEKIARRLNRHLQGEPLETAAGQEPWAGPDAHAGSTTCATCDLPLETSGERCPRRGTAAHAEIDAPLPQAGDHHDVAAAGGHRP